MNIRSRHQRIIDLLRQPGGSLTAADIAERLDVTPRTIYRDIDALRRQGQPIVAERGRNGGLRLADRPAAPLDAARPPITVAPARGEFIGRQPEMERLVQLLDSANNGRGGIAMLTGEPGIGKTRTAQELSDRARHSGYNVLWGRCLESEGVPAFWPWAQVIRAYADEVGQSQTLEEMGDGAADIATFVSDIRELLPGYVVPAPLEYPAPARFRIYESISRFLRSSSASAPMLIVLDDLQWADGPSLAVLEFIATELVSCRIFLVGTYRDDEVNRRDPLYTTLGELTRLVQPERLQLRGLTRQEVARYLEITTSLPPHSAIAGALHEQTNGNPLFLGEIVRLLNESRGHRSAAAGVELMGRIPEGVREVIGRRLDRLSERCNEILAVAAVISREFQVPVLAAACRVPERDLYNALAEAEGARLIEPVPGSVGSFQFTHPLVRQTLYDELSTLARANTHREVGEAIEQVEADRVEAFLPQLAYHFFEASRTGKAAKAVDYCRRAGEQAMRQLAPDEAAGLCQMALQALQLVYRRDSATESDLLIDLGNAQRDSGEFIEAMRTFRRAARVAAAASLAEQMARAAIGFEETTWRPGWPGDDAADLLEQAIGALPEEDSILRSRCLASYSRALIFSGKREHATVAWQEAVAIARRLEDPFTLSFALHTRLYDRWLDGLRDRVEVAAEVIEISRRMGDWDRAQQASAYRLGDLMALGDYQAVRDMFPDYLEATRKARHPFTEYVRIGFDTVTAIFDGRFEEAEKFAKQGLAKGMRLKGQDTEGVFGIQMFTIRRWQGRLESLAPIVQQFVEGGDSNSWRPGLAVIYAESGMSDKAREQFEILAESDFARIPRDSLWLGTMTYMADVCAFLGDTARAKTIYELLRPYQDTNVVIGIPPIALGAAHTALGMAAETKGDRDLAIGHHAAALEMNRKMGGPPTIARAEYELAALLVHSSDAANRQRASKLLDSASKTATALGMVKLSGKINAVLAASPARPFPAGLTPREVEVLRLIADGVANRVIADRLFITRNTVANHVKSILEKTQSANRTEAAAFAIRSGLLHPGRE